MNMHGKTSWFTWHGFCLSDFHLLFIWMCCLIRAWRHGYWTLSLVVGARNKCNHNNRSSSKKEGQTYSIAHTSPKYTLRLSVQLAGVSRLTCGRRLWGCWLPALCPGRGPAEIWVTGCRVPDLHLSISDFRPISDLGKGADCKATAWLPCQTGWQGQCGCTYYQGQFGWTVSRLEEEGNAKTGHSNSEARQKDCTERIAKHSKLVCRFAAHPDSPGLQGLTQLLRPPTHRRAALWSFSVMCCDVATSGNGTHCSRPPSLYPALSVCPAGWHPW